MKKSLTPKRERFAQLRHAGESLSDAYRGAFSAGNMSPAAIHVEASRIAQSPDVALRLQELRDESAQRNAVTVDSLVSELEQARIAALCAVPTAQIGAAVSATMGKAKLLGLDQPKAQPPVDPGALLRAIVEALPC